MNTKTMFTIVGIALVLGMAGTSVISLSTASAASDRACQNQDDRHDRFLFRDFFNADGNPNNDRGAAQSHQNSHKSLDNTCS